MMKDDPAKAPTGDKPMGAPWVRWEAKVGASVRQGWQSLQNGSNDVIKRIVASYQQFAKNKQL